MYYFAYIILGSAIMQFLLLPFYIRLKHNNKFIPLKITIKACMTLIAVVFCAFGIFRLYNITGDLGSLVLPSGFRTHILILIGLSICTVADVFLVINFNVGMVCFLIGHICYILYFLKLAPFSPISIPIYVVTSVITYFVYSRYKNNIGKLWPAYTVYGLVIIGTFSIAIMLPFSIGPYGIIPAIAALLLVISDFMLALNKLSRKKVLSDLMYLGYYFMGQYFLALSVYIPVYFNL